jgi:hypothetical protein
MATLQFTRNASGLGRPLTGKDHFTGLVFYIADGNLPSGYTTTDRTKKVFSITEAEALGLAEGSATNGEMWYHVNEFFRMAPGGVLFLSFQDSASIDLSKIEAVQQFADGELRQIGVYDPTTLTAGTIPTNLNTLQASATALEAIDRPLNVVYSGDTTGLALGSYPDLRVLTNKNVSMSIGQDGTGAGSVLSTTLSRGIGSIGLTMGTVSKSSVHENIGWVGEFPLVDGTEFDVPAFTSGELVKDTAAASLANLNALGYIFIKKYQDKTGSFFNDSHTAISGSNDLAYLENNRVIDKAIRTVRFFMLDNINSPLSVNASGQLSEDTIAVFKNDANRALEQLQTAGEIVDSQTKIDPTQDVLTTSEVLMTLEIVPFGVSRTIKVNIGFVPKLT